MTLPAFDCFLKSVLSNLLPRLRLIRTALTRRFIYDDIILMTRDYGLEYRDVKGQLEPFEFVALAKGTEVDLDFHFLREDARNFTPLNAPELFNSEPSVGHFLSRLIYYKKPKIVVELGCFVGWTSAHMAYALKINGEGELWCLDYRQDYLDITTANLQRHGLDQRVRCLQGMSLDSHILEKLPAQMDLIFLDTSHLYPETRDEIMLYSQRLSPSGLMVLHDSTSAHGVRRSLLEVATHFKIFTFATENSNGLTILMPKDS